MAFPAARAESWMPTAAFAEDSKTLRESQKAAIEQAGQLGGRLRDRVSKANLEQASNFMKDAEKQLGEAESHSSIPARVKVGQWGRLVRG